MDDEWRGSSLEEQASINCSTVVDRGGVCQCHTSCAGDIMALRSTM